MDYIFLFIGICVLFVIVVLVKKVNQHTKISDVSVVVKYIDGFNELIATKDIPKGTYIDDCYDDKEKSINRYYDTYMNDPNFIYPITLTKENLRKTFTKYQKSNKHNCGQITGTLFVTTKNINKGEPLTKQYGMNKWLLWLSIDIYNMNPFVLKNKRVSDTHYGRYYLPNYNLSDEDKKIAIENLKEVVKEFDYVFSFDPLKSLNENIENIYKIKK